MTYEFEAKTEKEAIELAAAELVLEAEQFDEEILETQKNSIFKKGYVRIRVQTEDVVSRTGFDTESEKSLPRENSPYNSLSFDS